MSDKLTEICDTKRVEVETRKGFATVNDLDARAAGQSARAVSRLRCAARPRMALP